MNRFGRRTVKDLTQDGIVKALEQAYIEVWCIERPVDLLIRRHSWPAGLALLMEVKTSRRKRADQAKQAETLAQHGIPVVCTAVEALQAVHNVDRWLFP